jgi:hypothetical protein
VKAKAGHRICRQIEQIHRVGAKVRLRRDSWTAPFDHPGSDIRYFHCSLSTEIITKDSKSTKTTKNNTSVPS